MFITSSNTAGTAHCWQFGGTIQIAVNISKRNGMTNCIKTQKPVMLQAFRFKCKKELKELLKKTFLKPGLTDKST